MSAPAYFEPIRREAAARWDTLERDPVLAGPWHQLFKQVQSPRHVLSELLQNADDAGAAEASVHIEDNMFIFRHNGEDFTEEHFQSLCRFGYSNKRALHTIGFRGIGFKSTFSLGDVVELRTPTLGVAFGCDRFTEPRWIERDGSVDGATEIRVAIADGQRALELHKNLMEWINSPLSLLFFRTIRQLQINSDVLRWDHVGPGPAPNTEWMALGGDGSSYFLVARSEAEPFPAEALKEIRQERLIGADSQLDFPPCRVEIVLGSDHRLYVVLPTGVRTTLPFACNAPFIQDPARLKIKDPETSPTNRWLLARAGALAAEVMHHWLDSELPDHDRADAYRLVPVAERENSSIEATCTACVDEAFTETLEGRPWLLTDEGQLVREQAAIGLPDPLLRVWPDGRAGTLFDDRQRPPLSRSVATDARRKLVERGVVEEIALDGIIDLLKSKHLPRPETWDRLLTLWAYLCPALTRYQFAMARSDVRIVPVQGQEVLHAASDVVRLGDKKLLGSDDDWQFLSRHLLVLNPNWQRYLVGRQRAVDQGQNLGADDVEQGYALLRLIGMDEASDAASTIDLFAKAFFEAESVQLLDCVRLTQIVAKLGVPTDDAFRLVSQDRHFRRRDDILIDGRDEALEELIPPGRRESWVLHRDYTREWTSCTAEEWQRWLASGRSGIESFLPLRSVQRRLYREADLRDELEKRDFVGDLARPYKTHAYVIHDWDFDDVVWQHWRSLASSDPQAWGRIMERILRQPTSFWGTAASARALQIATTGNTKPVTGAPLTPGWILKFRELPCLPDTHRVFRKPHELLRRTPETEPVMDVEAFLHAALDTESVRPLLILMGVRDAPTGPNELLRNLRTLAQADEPPAHEVEKWYRRLDQMMDACSTEDLGIIRQAFQEEPIILAESGVWCDAPGIFQASNEEAVPGAELIRRSVADLTLWRKVGVPDRPTEDLAIEWLLSLPSGQALHPKDLKRVRALLGRFPTRIWDQCRHWLNLAGQWVPVDDIAYGLTMQSLFAWGHLLPWVREKTGDFQPLPTEVSRSEPFQHIPPLSSKIENQLHGHAGALGEGEEREWLTELGSGLRRMVLNDATAQERVRTVARDLRATRWLVTPGLEVIPYLDGTPAGTPKRVAAAWLDRVLHVENQPTAKLAKAVAQEVGSRFGLEDIGDAVKMCYDRPASFVVQYLEANFTLAAQVDLGAETEPPVEPEMPADQVPETPFDGEPRAGGGEEEGPSAGGGAVDNQEIDQRGGGAQAGPGPRPRQVRPSIMERFAIANGFQKDNAGRYHHPDGGWIEKVTGSPFPWERRDASGVLRVSYLAKDHCLEREPLEIGADQWQLIQDAPAGYALIITTPEGLPREIDGATLLQERDAGRLALYPATYRLAIRGVRTGSPV